MYQYGIKNKYVAHAPWAYGLRAGGAGYSAADVPTQLLDTASTGLTTEVLRHQFAYEWFQSGAASAGFGGRGSSNPPFLSGAAGRLNPALTAPGGGPARILRGYIRRADYEKTDPLSKTRLYFMYNPETITREYVSYLEQSALDPFNTVYQSGNAIAPPSILNFSFELFFDRQEEAAQDANHPGVFVDYQFFDMVVRNVIPADPKTSSDTLPDNGVMMINPRDITVIFSPQISVQGRPTNASVIFEKFTHRMIPVRMRVQLQILASYFGPVRDMTEYKTEELKTEDAIPIDAIKPTPFTINTVDVEGSADNYNGIPGSYKNDVIHYGDQVIQANDANHHARLTALEWAKNNVIPGITRYDNNTSGKHRWDLPYSADCSGLVTESYIQIGHGGRLGWRDHPGTDVMMSRAAGNRNLFYYVPLSAISSTGLLPGDLLIRAGHVAFFVGYAGSNSIDVFEASGRNSNPPVGQHRRQGRSNFTHLLRPTPLGATSSAAQASSYNRGLS